MDKHIELTPRLQMVADLIPAGGCLADVGTDHAYLPVALLQRGNITSAIAADLRDGPLKRARTTAAEHHLTKGISFCLCDGLTGISGGEVQSVAIAGMGGETIAHILSAAPWTRELDIPLILQPMSTQKDLRLWLLENGYNIHQERLAREGDTLYVAILVGAGSMAPLTPAELEVGRQSRDPLRGQWLNNYIKKTQYALDGMAKAQSQAVANRINELEQLKTELLRMKEEWDGWQL